MLQAYIGISWYMNSKKLLKIQHLRSLLSAILSSGSIQRLVWALYYYKILPLLVNTTYSETYRTPPLDFLGQIWPLGNTGYRIMQEGKKNNLNNSISVYQIKDMYRKIRNFIYNTLTFMLFYSFKLILSILNLSSDSSTRCSWSSTYFWH